MHENLGSGCVASQAERWALLGNAVSVAVARWLGERLRLPHRFKYTAGAQDQCFPIPAGSQEAHDQPSNPAANMHLAQERAFQVQYPALLAAFKRTP